MMFTKNQVVVTKMLRERVNDQDRAYGERGFQVTKTDLLLDLSYGYINVYLLIFLYIIFHEKNYMKRTYFISIIITQQQ